MANAARAIIMDENRLLLIHREKYGSKYFTLVGGRIHDNETAEQGLVREVKEETGLDITKSRLVYFEDHPEPYNKQYVYLCEVAAGGEAQIQDYSEEGQMNKLGANVHEAMWVNKKGFDQIPFRTPQLQTAIVDGLKNGFPEQPVRL